MKLVSTPDQTAAALYGAPVDDFPFTFLPGYAEYLARNEGKRVVLVQSDELGATAPLCLFKDHWLRLGQWLNPPLRAGRSLPTLEEQAFLEAANQVLRDRQICDRLVSPPPHALFQAVPRGSRHFRFGSYALEMAGRSAEDIFASFRRDHRRDITRAQDRGVTVRSGAEQVPVFHGLYKQSHMFSKLWFSSLDSTVALADALGPQHSVCVVSYTSDGEPQGGTFVAYTRHSAVNLRSGTVAPLRVEGAGKIVFWEAIRQCAERGVAQYHLPSVVLRAQPGTKDEGLKQFKSGFGTELREGYLWKLDLCPGRGALYDGVRSAYRWLRYGQPFHRLDFFDTEGSIEQLGAARRGGDRLAREPGP